MLTPDEIRRVNLIEALSEQAFDQIAISLYRTQALSEQAFEQGLNIPSPPDDAAQVWSDDDIRGHFAALLQTPSVSEQPRKVLPPTPPPSPAHTLWSEPPPAALSRLAQPPQVMRGGLPPSASSQPQQQQQQKATADTFEAWFPGLALSRTACANPRLRVICFHSAGNAQDMFTSEGTGARRAPSPLLEWCRSHSAEMLAVQLPGRAERSREAPCGSAQKAAGRLLPLLRHALAAAPYVVVSHSMGSWVAFELLRSARQEGLPMPVAWFLSAMPAPDIPDHARPWRRQRTLDDREFQAECRGWDINETVFAAGMWETYEPQLRADFRIFDEYVYRPEEGAAAGGTDAAARGIETEAAPSVMPFAVPISAFWGAQDRRVTEQMVQEWRRFTSGPFCCQQAAGNHLWPLHKEHKAAWLQVIVQQLEAMT